MSVIIDGTNGIDKIAAGAIEKADLPAGSVLQVVTTFLTTQISQAGSDNTWYAISGLSAAITPSSSSSKIFAMVSLGKCGLSSGTSTTAFRLKRNGTAIGVGVPTGSQPASSYSMVQWANDGNHAAGGSFSYLDSPASTSSLTYSVDWYPQTGNTAWLNRGSNNSSDIAAYFNNSGSSITLMEVAG